MKVRCVQCRREFDPYESLVLFGLIIKKGGNYVCEKCFHENAKSQNDSKQTTPGAPIK